MKVYGDFAEGSLGLWMRRYIDGVTTNYHQGPYGLCQKSCVSMFWIEHTMNHLLPAFSLAFVCGKMLQCCYGDVRL